MKTQRSKPLAGVHLPFREIALKNIQTEPLPIRIVQRSFSIEIPVTVQPDQLTALVRGLV